MPEPPAWIRPAVALVALVGVGAVALAGVGWLATRAVPEGDDRAAGLAADPSGAPTVVEIGEAGPGDAVVQVDRCTVVDGVIEAGGRLQNTSGEEQAFLVHLAVLVDDRLFDGTTEEVAVTRVPDGASRDWTQRVGAVDLDGPVPTPTCAVDRVGLGRELEG